MILISRTDILKGGSLFSITGMVFGDANDDGLVVEDLGKKTKYSFTTDGKLRIVKYRRESESYRWFIFNRTRQYLVEESSYHTISDVKVQKFRYYPKYINVNDPWISFVSKNMEFKVNRPKWNINYSEKEWVEVVNRMSKELLRMTQTQLRL